MKYSPFRTSKKRQIEFAEIGSPERGTIYLVKKGGIAPAENPADVKQALQDQTEATIIFLQAVKNCAAQEGISQSDARTKIFPSGQSTDLNQYLDPTQALQLVQLLKKAVSACANREGITWDVAKRKVMLIKAASAIQVVGQNDIYDFLEPDEISIVTDLQSKAEQAYQQQNTVRADIAKDQIQHMIRELVVQDVDLYDYLTPEQAVKLINLKGDEQDTALKAATLFIQNRLAYPIIVNATAKPKVNQLEIEPLRFTVAIGNQFRIGDVIVDATDVANYDAETLTITPLPQQIQAGAVGFLLDMTGQERLGDPDWTIDHTRQYLLEPEIQAIYEFYKEEAGIAVNKTEAPALNSADDSVAGAAGNSMMILPDSPNTSIKTPSTGLVSTGESSPLVSTTNGSTPIILEASLTG